MTLRSFHAVFISASALLAFFFAAWCLASTPTPGPGRLAAGAASAAAGLGLVAYETWFLRKTPPGLGQAASGGRRRLP